MYPITNEVMALFESEQRKVLRITGTDKNGATITITDNNVIEDSFQIDRYSCNGEKLEIGTAIAAQMNLTLENGSGQYNGIVFEGAELFVEVGTADWTQSSPTVHWVPCGYFTPDEQPRRLSTISITALDRMTKFDAVPPILTPWTTANGDVMTTASGEIIYFVSNLSFPTTVAQLVRRTAIICNVPFTQDLSGFPNSGVIIDEITTPLKKITYRNIIQWCAGIMGCNAWIDWTGALRFSWYDNATGYSSTIDNRYSSDLYENNISITGVTYTNASNITLVSGIDEYAIELTGNYLAANALPTIMSAINGVVNGFTYRPFMASVVNAPYLWPMDAVTFTDKDGNSVSTILTNVAFGLNGSTALESRGMTWETNSRKAPKAVTKDQALLIDQAMQTVKDDVDESLTQQDIFNRLTDNGAAQGIVLYDGQLYVNASYIQSGTLKLGGLNNINGQMQVLDASGDVIGMWNKDGITLNKGSISGPSITLGGNGNANGAITVKDANGNTIGTWDNSGVSLNKGAISGPSITLGGNNNGNGTITVKDANGNTIGTWNMSGISVSSGSININNNFVVSNNGSLEANNATIQGSILSKSPQGATNTNITNISEGIIGFGSSNPRSYDSLIDGHIEYQGALSIPTLKIGMNGGSYILFQGTDVDIYGDFQVTGAKSRSVSTSQYSDRLLYCYETPSPMFGDIGEGAIGEDGLCYIAIDAVFAQTIVTKQYQVFLQRYGAGDCWVKERNGRYFVVKGTPGLSFGWEIKAKQRDYDQLRLEKNEIPFTVPKQSYGADAAQYINNLMKERIS